MAGKKQLPPVRVVQEGETVAPQSYGDSIARGTRLDELKALRRVLASHIDHENTLARDLAPLMRQAREISQEVEELSAIEAGYAMDAEVRDGSISTDWDASAI